MTARESRYTAGKVLYCQAVSVLVFCSRIVHSMSSAKEQRVSSPLTSELAVDEREKASTQAGEGEGTS